MVLNDSTTSEYIYLFTSIPHAHQLLLLVQQENE